MWFKVDDKFWQHPKLEAVPRGRRNEAAGLWVRGGSWCAMNLTDGHIPDTIAAERLDAKPATVRDLESVRLWVPELGGWVMHDWELWQPTRDEVEQRKEVISAARSEAGRRGAKKRWAPEADSKPDGKRMASCYRFAIRLPYLCA